MFWYSQIRVKVRYHKRGSPFLSCPLVAKAHLENNHRLFNIAPEFCIVHTRQIKLFRPLIKATTVYKELK